MFTQGIELDVQAYGEYILANQPFIDVASNLDMTGKTEVDCQKTYENQKFLESMGCEVCPVFHTREDEKWLRRYLDEGYEYIFIGGMVPETTPFLRNWLDGIWEKYLVNPDGTARVKVHGFGLTTTELMNRYPWHSVDSTSWVMTGVFGSINLDLPHGDFKIAFSDQSPTVKEAGKHFDNLDPVTRRAVEHRVRELGYDPALLRTHYGWRDHFNINYYKRCLERPDPVFNRREISLFGL